MFFDVTLSVHVMSL